MSFCPWLRVSFHKPALATNGYFQNGYGAKTKALGGAGVAAGQDALTLALNPAGLIKLDNGLDLGFSMFSPQRAVTASGGGDFGFPPDGRVESGNELFVIPHFGVSYRLDDKNSVGFAIYGNGGMNTEFPAFDRQCPDPASGAVGPGSGLFCAGAAGVDLIQLFFAPGYAHQVTDRISIGISPIFSVQRFEAEGIGSFAALSSAPDRLSNQSADYAFGAGFRLGAQMALTDRLEFGISYVSRIYMDKFEKFSGLFADQGGFDIPPALTAGLAFKASDHLMLYGDYQRIWYSNIRSIGNPFASTQPLGAQDGPGFGWRDVDVARFGAEWAINDQWALRAGYAYNDQPVQPSEVLFNILAPGVVRHHITAGLSRTLFGSVTGHLGGMYAPESSVSGANPLNPAQQIRLEMHQFELTAGITIGF
ncbi:OmpP1/FadL family transporter [Iodidimonas gelatinilytica]|uniref:OmpP1/FadL family transporter n=1 Tax=Iodidimonas gelatinilytica TaxID=1236966 RepID=UPI001B2FF599|nr:outer membrane protein transport protein [Iodidimonas gelatinilytica]